MLGPQRLLADGEAAAIERLGLGVAALGPVQLGQVVEDVPTSGCSGPSAFSRMASTRLAISVASGYLPARYSLSTSALSAAASSALCA